MANSRTQLLLLLTFFFFLVLLGLVQVQAQQDYLNNKQLNCSNTDPITAGYACNTSSGDPPTCQSYLTFRSTAPYTSLATIAFLLKTDTAAMATLNDLTDIESIPSGTPIIAPANCSCAGTFYEHNASYVLKDEGETYFTVANDTYQGLSTCQALEAHNPYKPTELEAGMSLLVPLRCACPTAAQSSSGVLYLLSFMVIPGDDPSKIAQLFGVTEQSVLGANNLNEDDVIYPYQPILVPLTKEPTKIVLPTTSPPPPPPAGTAPATPTGGGSSSSKKWLYVGVGIGVALVAILGAVAYWALYYGRRKQEQAPPASAPPPKKASESVTDYSALPTDSSSWSVSGIRGAIDSLTIYRYEDLQKATESFAEENKIRGSVYRGKFKGDDAAVKVVKGDVSSEIKILKLINHSNIIRLSGFCLHEGNSYLVYEYAENGSLSDWLHSGKDLLSTLSWKQRIQIAYNIADAINYLHNYANPPYIHKNLKSSNVLLDGNFRAKVSNFGLARSVESENGGLQLTRHVVGTQGYMSPEYIENGVITPKLDVFAFGVVMLELLSGREAVGKNKDREELLSSAINRVVEGDNVRDKLREFIDPSLRDEYPLDLAFSMVELARKCVAYDLNSRPVMPEVLMILSKILSSSLDWDPSDELNKSRSMSHGR
ncbi:protein LYK5 [Punica granatum]|uniref:Uncharacterized protein n=2 Tax=Punica granatum TaxID=22663 RepID=A0A2I0JEP3_PUNGR|nr:protein LYK5 [Punica granatum]PKI54725.1 hypothetical protein CRG98_024925 [Punica granatum]